MQPRAVLFLHLFDRTNLPSKPSQLRKFLLNSLQPFLSLPVGDLRIRLISLLPPIPLVQLLNLSNLHPEKPDLFPQNFEMIHTISIAYLENPRVAGAPGSRAFFGALTWVSRKDQI
jgi:hypothetical protein